MSVSSLPSPVGYQPSVHNPESIVHVRKPKHLFYRIFVTMYIGHMVRWKQAVLSLWSVGAGDIIMMYGMENRFLLVVSCVEIMWLSKWVHLLNNYIVLQHFTHHAGMPLPAGFYCIINGGFNH